MKLRTYQDNFIKTISEYLSRMLRVVAQLATGGGKTVTFAGICNRYLKKANPTGTYPGKGKTVLILVHRKELLQQTRKTCYNAFNIVCQPVIAGMKYIPPAEVYVGMVETVNRILKKPNGVQKFGDIGIVIIDECHRLEFMKVHQYFPKTFIIGFSATPMTASKKKPLKNFYDDIVCGIDIPELIANKNLCQNITYVPKDTVNRLNLAMKGDEFDETKMGMEFSKVKYIHNTVSAYERWAKGKKTIIFNVNINHSKTVTDAFVAAGYNAKHVDGEMSDEERNKIFAWFHNTPDAILNNVGIATTGLDQPDIETVMVNRSTQSMPLWLQMCGRGSRPTPMKSMFIIVDMGGNAITHGDWCQPRDWYDLFHNPPKPGKNNVAPVKICPSCMAVIPAASRECPLCGHKFESKTISVETDLHDFIVITKGIDVEKVINENKEKKEYYALFKIGGDLADYALQTVPEMNNEYAEYILERYIELAQRWMKRINEVNEKKKRFNQWHKVKCKDHLYSELKSRFPKWDYDPKQPPQTTEAFVIQNLKALEQLHYNH